MYHINFPCFRSSFDNDWFWNNRTKRQMKFEFEVIGVVENQDFDNYPLNANSTNILAF